MSATGKVPFAGLRLCGVIGVAEVGVLTKKAIRRAFIDSQNMMNVYQPEPPIRKIVWSLSLITRVERFLDGFCSLPGQYSRVNAIRAYRGGYSVTRKAAHRETVSSGQRNSCKNALQVDGPVLKTRTTRNRS